MDNNVTFPLANDIIPIDGEEVVDPPVNPPIEDEPEDPKEYFAQLLSSDRTKKLFPLGHPKSVIDSKGITLNTYLNRTSFYQEGDTAGGIQPGEIFTRVRLLNRAGDLILPVTLMSQIYKDVSSDTTLDDIIEEMRHSAVIQIQSHFTNDIEDNTGPIPINIIDFKKDNDVLEVYLDRGDTGSLVNGERLTLLSQYTINEERNAIYLLNGLHLKIGDVIHFSVLRTIKSDDLKDAVELIHSMFDTSLTYDTLAAEDEIPGDPIPVDDNINTFKGHKIEEFMLWAQFDPKQYTAYEVEIMPVDSNTNAQNLKIQDFKFTPGCQISFKTKMDSEMVNYIAINGQLPLYQILTVDMSPVVSFKKNAQLSLTLSDTKGINPAVQNCLTAFFSGGGGTTTDETLPPQVTNLVVVPTYQTLTVSFEEVPDDYKQYVSGYRIVLKEGGVPSTPNDGTFVDIQV